MKQRVLRGFFGWIWVAAMTASLSTFGQSQPTNCPTLREGKFEIDDIENGGTWTITRKAGIQREENEAMGVAVEYLVEWIDDCTYRLLPYNVIRNDARLELGGDAKFIVEIIEINDDSFVQETTIWTTGQYITAEVKIVK